MVSMGRETESLLELDSDKGNTQSNAPTTESQTPQSRLSTPTPQCGISQPQFYASFENRTHSWPSLPPRPAAPRSFLSFLRQSNFEAPTPDNRDCHWCCCSCAALNMHSRIGNTNCLGCAHIQCAGCRDWGWPEEERDLSNEYNTTVENTGNVSGNKLEAQPKRSGKALWGVVKETLMMKVSRVWKFKKPPSISYKGLLGEDCDKSYWDWSGSDLEEVYHGEVKSAEL